MPSSSKSKLSAVLSKRRPRQNIIAMILKSAKGSGGSTGSGGKSNSSKGDSGSTTGGEKSSSRMKSFSSSSSRTKRNIIQSAVDLTGKLSKRTTRKRHGRSGGKGGRSGQSGSIVKGQKAFYRSSKGICKVTVVGVHHDAKLEPYYTIRMRDGKEKQADGKHLTPIQELDSSIKKGSSHGEQNGEERGEMKSSERRESTTKSKVCSVDVSVTDQMSDSSSDGGSAVGSFDGSSASSIDASFSTGQNAYYRSSEGHISKVKVVKVYPSSSKCKYGIDLPDGTSKDVEAHEIKALMDLTSDELAILMKEKNEKPRSKEILALPSIEDVDPGYEPCSEKCEDSSEETEQEVSDNSHQQQQKPETEPLALPCSVQMVEAKTEDGGTKTVPKYAVGTELYYKNAQGVQKATILGSHLDDLLDPYYSIRLECGKEKQTDNAHLMMTWEGSDAEKKAEEEDTEAVVEETTDGESPVSETGVENGIDSSAKEEDAHATEEFALVPVDLSKNTDTSEEKHAEPPAHALALAHNFAVGDDVLYNSSQGEHFQVTIAKLLRDKKHRPYYVVRLRDGKEKQVYGHRLSPLRVGRDDLSSADRSKRSGRSRSTTRRRARSEAPKRSMKRSDSIDSRGGTSSHAKQQRRGSISSDEKGKSVTRSKSLSRASARSRSQNPNKSRSRSRVNEDLKLRKQGLRKSVR